jgi:DNA uptake protein ComE-like DNA-binding protein
MNLALPTSRRAAGRESASVLIVVLWICIGLVSITLYFANSMTYELQAADNRVNGLTADQAIEGAARYVSYALSTYATNGATPDNTQFSCANVAIGGAHFWIIGRDPSGTPSSEPYFGLIDEGSKLNLNRVGTNTLSYLPNMDNDYDLAQSIVDWRNTNGTPDLSYAQYGYTEKEAPFETVDELRLIDGMTIDLLDGDDLNRNGVLDANEKDVVGNGQVEPGLLEYLTVYSREPNYHSDGSLLTNVNVQASTTGKEQLEQLFQNAGLSMGWADNVYNNYEHPGGGTFTTLLQFYLYCNQKFGMTSSQFALIYDNITVTASVPGTYKRGRLNINTASADVMTALFMGTGVDQDTAESAAQSLVSYRDQNPGDINSVAWIVDALGPTSPVVSALKSRDVITTQSYQFTADIAAVGPFGRGYERVKFIFDISEGFPKILYRQDLSRLGWALGKTVREETLAVNATK